MPCTTMLRSLNRIKSKEKKIRKEMSEMEREAWKSSPESPTTCSPGRSRSQCLKMGLEVTRCTRQGHKMGPSPATPLFWPESKPWVTKSANLMCLHGPKPPHSSSPKTYMRRLQLKVFRSPLIIGCRLDMFSAKMKFLKVWAMLCTEFSLSLTQTEHRISHF